MTAQELATLKHAHKTEISALNAIVQLTAETSADVAGAATETTSASIATKLTAVSKTTAISRPTTSGTITAGKNSVIISNVGLANGTVKTVTLKPGETAPFDGGAMNNTLDAIAYDATGTEFLITTVA